MTFSSWKKINTEHRNVNYLLKEIILSLLWRLSMLQFRSLNLINKIQDKEQFFRNLHSLMSNCFGWLSKSHTKTCSTPWILERQVHDIPSKEIKILPIILFAINSIKSSIIHNVSLWVNKIKPSRKLSNKRCRLSKGYHKWEQRNNFPWVKKYQQTLSLSTDRISSANNLQPSTPRFLELWPSGPATLRKF